MARGGKWEGAGRPLGRPNKIVADVKALAQDYGAQAVEALAKILRESESDQAKIAAARELLDRGYGKPTQDVNLAGAGGAPLAAPVFNVTFGVAEDGATD